jgi:predicted small lipoprotein YifL
MKRILSSLIVIGVTLAACGPSGPPARPASTVPADPSTAPSAAVPATPSGSTPSVAAGEGQTDTDWGRIWDTLPSSFPSIPGARPSEEAATGPASATMVIEGNVARLVAAALVTQLAAAGFPTAGLGTPLEDGSYTLDATGATPGCKVQLTIKPMGDQTIVSILYGAACAHD